MRKIKTGNNSGGFAQPEIRIGDRWKDSHGSIITIAEQQFNRVVFYREGYHSPCICTKDRLCREFTMLDQSPITGEKDVSDSVRPEREVSRG